MMEEKRISNRDWEKLSAYLDGQLSNKDLAKLKARFNQEPELRKALHEISKTRAAVRSLPLVRAPRNFTLKPEMVGLQTRTPRLYPVFRLASVLASILFIIIALGDALKPGSPPPIERALPAMAPNQIVGEVQEKSAVKESQPLEIATNMPGMETEVEMPETPVPEEELTFVQEVPLRDAIEESGEIQSSPRLPNQVATEEETGTSGSKFVSGGNGVITQTTEMLTATLTFEDKEEEKAAITSTITETKAPEPTSTPLLESPEEVHEKVVAPLGIREIKIALLLVAFLAGVTAFWLRRRR